MKNPVPPVDELGIVGKEEESIFKQFLAGYDVPAYIRWARQTEAAWEDLLSRCHRQHEKWLVLVRQRLGTLPMMAGDRARLVPWLKDEAQLAVVVDLLGNLKPASPRCAVLANSSRSLKRALREVRESLERFNRRWEEFLGALDRLCTFLACCTLNEMPRNRCPSRGVRVNWPGQARRARWLLPRRLPYGLITRRAVDRLCLPSMFPLVTEALRARRPACGSMTVRAPGRWVRRAPVPGEFEPRCSGAAWRTSSPGAMP